MTEQKTIEQLKQAIAIAATTGDDNTFNSLIKEYNSRKAEVAKAMQVAAQKEAEALAGVREKLATAIHKSVMKIQGLAEDLAAVKATGFTFKLDADGIVYKSVALAVPTIKAAKTTGGNGGGGTGKTKAEFGMSMSEILTAFGTDEERAKGAELKAKGKVDRADSDLYSLQKVVKKRAIAEGKLQPAK